MTATGGFAGEPFLEDLRDLDRTGFAICAFFSTGDGYERYGRRLADSCRRFELPHSVWRAPAVHCSISLRGSPDLRFTKPSFIGFCLDRLAGAGVAYLDVDTIVAAHPQAFFDARAGRRDLAIYNWLADPHNEAYLPANRKLVSPEPESHFYLFSHRVEWTGTVQLNCSGVTQFYADTPGARALLAGWQQVIAENPRAADDQSLSFAHNNPVPGAPPVNALWLDKSYARCPYWPHVQPVILHPAIPAVGQPHAALVESGGRRWIHLDRCAPNTTPLLFPREGGVDASTGITFRLDAAGRPQPTGHYGGRFWIYSEDPAPGEVA